jgi:hypothetical protein
MIWDAATETVAIRTLKAGDRFQVAGLGERCGVVLRISDLYAYVVYDKRGTERREPIGVALSLRVIPL